MNPLALAVQGIGFGVLAVAVQGYVAVEEPVVITPVPVPAAIATVYDSSNQKPYRQFKWIAETKKAEVAVKPVKAKSTVSVPVPTAGVALELLPQTVRGTVKPPEASGTASASIRAVSFGVKVGQVAAVGQHDIEDEELLAILLTLLQE
jgi:hypothetical protein